MSLPVLPRRARLAFLLGLGCAATAPAAAQTDAPSHVHYAESREAELPSPTGQIAPRLLDLGSHSFPAPSCSPEARTFVAQGVNLTYGFNHAEAARSFREAARLDPGCALAFWGQALVIGPNINAPMDPAEEPRAQELARQAAVLAEKASERERAYVEALLPRYTGDADERKAGDAAYAEAMRELARRLPNDLDAATMAAEALMDLRPWDYWTGDGQPYPETREIVALLESVLERNPNHPGAAHLYIHAMEATYPERAEAAADRLQHLMPGAGHMVHMPSHIYARVGRFADAAAANERAALADESYITQCRAQGLYPMAYYPHNIHFLWYAASLEGRSKVALESARKVASKIDDGALTGLPMLAGFRVVPYWAMIRFGQWDALLSEPSPPESNLFLVGAWRFARGLALTRTGRLEEAEAELVALREIVADKDLRFTLFSPNLASDILAIAPDVLSAELLAAAGDFDAAIARLDRAVRLEDALVYTEPAEWAFSVRHALGAVLLAAKRPREAEIVYWEDLRRTPGNGYALFGLAAALQAQGKDTAAAGISERFAKAWARADVELTASRY